MFKKEKKLSFTQKLFSVFKSKTTKNKEEFLEDLEDTLLNADLGARVSTEIIKEIELNIKENKLKDEEAYFKLVYDLLDTKLKSIELKPIKNKTSCYIFFGINGVGKTTSIAKIGNYYNKNNYKVIFGAGDTFRAAGAEQLKIHGDRLKIRTIAQNTGTDPGAVVYDTVFSAISKKEDLALIDTAGRMHTRKELMAQASKLDRIIENKLKLDGEYKKILVLDGNTGQNALSQVEIFNEAIKIDALVISKFDAISKFGIIIPIIEKYNIPIAFIGTGENYDDIEVFDSKKFLDKLFVKDE